MKFRLAGSEKPIIMVETEVNGKGPFSFAVDTGASMTVISEHLAETLDISKKTATPKKGQCCGGEIGTAVTTVESLQVGSVEAKDINVALVDLTAISKAVGMDLEGIIGYNFMKDYSVIIDYPQQEISFKKT